MRENNASESQQSEILDRLFFDADSKIQNDIVLKYLRLNAKSATDNKNERVKKLEVVVPRHNISWWKLPKNYSYNFTYDKFRRNISVLAIEEILKDICHGNIALGVEYFSKSPPNISHSKINQTLDSVTNLFQGLSKLFDYLYFINDAMISMDKLSEETIDDVDQAVRQFGDLYRVYFEKDAPPKIHWLEVHLVRKLRIFSRVGPNREDPIEREHQIHNRERIKASNIRNFLQLQHVVDRIIGASYIPGVAAIIETMSRKRNFSSKSDEKKQDKMTASKNEKMLKLEEWKK